MILLSGQTLIEQLPCFTPPTPPVTPPTPAPRALRGSVIQEEIKSQEISVSCVLFLKVKGSEGDCLDVHYGHHDIQPSYTLIHCAQCTIIIHTFNKLFVNKHINYTEILKRTNFCCSSSPSFFLLLLAINNLYYNHSIFNRSIGSNKNALLLTLIFIIVCS